MAGESLLPPVIAVLLADTKEFTSKMDGAIGKMAEVDGASSTAGARIEQNLGKMALATIGLGVGIGAAGIKMAMDFGSAMTSVQNSAGLSEAATKNLQNAFLNTAFKTEFSATEIAKAYAGVAGQLELLNGKQLSTSQAMDFVNQASDLATAKQISLSDAMGATTQTMKAFQTPVVDAGNVTNALYVTAGLTGSSVDALAGQFTKMHSKLGGAIPSLGDMNTLMVDMTAHGVGQGRALMTVTGAMTKLLDPSTKNVQLLQDMGIHAYDATGKFVGMGQIIKQLQPDFAGLNQEQQIQAATTLFGASAASAMLTLINAGPAAYDAASKSIQNHSTVMQGAATQSQNLSNQLKTLQSGLSDILIQVGLALLPTAEDLMNWAKNAINFFKDHPLISEIASDATIGAFALAVAFKVGKAMKSVWDAGASAFNTLKNLFTGGVKNTPIDLNTAALQANTDALLGKTGTGALGGAGEAAGGAGLGGVEGAGLGAGEGAAVLFGLATLPELIGGAVVGGIALGLSKYVVGPALNAGFNAVSPPKVVLPSQVQTTPQKRSGIWGAITDVASWFTGETPVNVSPSAPTGAQINHAGRQGGNAGVPNLPSAPLALLPGTKVGIQGIVGTDLNSAGVAKGISTTANNSSHLAGIPGIRNSTAQTASHTSDIARALSKTNKIVVTARFT